MISFVPGRGHSNRFEVLCIGAHSDDIEIGCGGTMLEIKKHYPQAQFHWFVLTAGGTRLEEAETAAKLFTSGHSLRFSAKEFKDGYLPWNGAAVKDCFEELKQHASPDLIFTHWSNDAHQDHRLLSDLTWNTFRDHCILEYEIPKYDGDLGRPNVFVPLSADTCEQKLEFLFQAFETQRSKRWFDREMFRGLMRMRGMECQSPSRYAEAFHARKLVLSPGN